MRKPRKPQERTAVTRDLLLTAAEQVFARVGYEKAQVEEIALAAGFSKGALYAHFKSKEELFLALYETKTAASLATLHQALDSAPTREGKIAAFRRFYIDLSKEKDWALITLEVKLFIRRHPEVRERLRRIDEHVADSIDFGAAEIGRDIERVRQPFDRDAGLPFELIGEVLREICVGTLVVAVDRDDPWLGHMGFLSFPSAADIMSHLPAFRYHGRRARMESGHQVDAQNTAYFGESAHRLRPEIDDVDGKDLVETPVGKRKGFGGGQLK